MIASSARIEQWIFTGGSDSSSAICVFLMLAASSRRLPFTHSVTSEDEVDYAADRIIEAVQKLRNMSPLWEMAQEGIDIKSIKWAAH